MRATHLLPALLLHQLLLLPTAIPAAGQFFYHFASDPRPPRSRSMAPLPRSAAAGRALGRRAGRCPQVAARRSLPAARRSEPAGGAGSASPCVSGRAGSAAEPSGAGRDEERSPEGGGSRPGAAEGPPLPEPAPCGSGRGARSELAELESGREGKENHIIAQRCSRPLSGRDRVSLISSGRINVK